MNRLDLKSCSILVVEDEFVIAMEWRRLLESWGAVVLGPAPTSEQALALLASTDQIDFAVVDINLRGEMSFALADALRVRAIPFVFATGYETPTIPERHRGSAIVQKPINPSQLAHVLLTHCI